MRLPTSPRPLADSLIGLFLSYLIFTGLSFGQSTIDLVWDPCPETDIAGYELYYGTASGSYAQKLDSGLPTTAALPDLTPGVTYYCAVRAYNTASLAGPLSEEISFIAPELPAPQTAENSIAGNATNAPEISIQQADGNEMAGGTTLRFSNSIVGATGNSETLLIRNTGTGNLSHLSITLDGTNGSEFAVDPLQTTELAPGETTSVQIRFEPASAGGKNATLHVASNDADEGGFEIPLTGTGIAALKIAVTPKGGSPLTDAAPLINFGDIALPKSSKPKVITITNRGTSTLTGLRLTKSGLHSADFRTTRLQKTTLAPGASTTFTVTFKPTAGGIRQGAIHIASNDADEGSFDMELTGNGIPAAQKPLTSLSSTTLQLALKFTSTHSVTVIDGKKFRTLTLTWPAGNRDPDTVVEVSPDLLDWFSGDDYTTVLVSNATTLKVRDNTPVTLGEKRYIRMKPGSR